jgi:hypothetical protein
VTTKRKIPYKRKTKLKEDDTATVGNSHFHNNVTKNDLHEIITEAMKLIPPVAFKTAAVPPATAAVHPSVTRVEDFDYQQKILKLNHENKERELDIKLREENARHEKKMEEWRYLGL